MLLEPLPSVEKAYGMVIQVEDQIELNRRTETLFEMTHADVWGSYGEENVTNSRYVLTIVEDHIRYMDLLDEF